MERRYAARILAKLGDEDGMRYCLNDIGILVNAGSEPQAKSGEAELETLSSLCGVRIIPEVIVLARELPANRRRPILSALYFLTKQQFSSLEELEQCWERNRDE